MAEAVAAIAPPVDTGVAGDSSGAGPGSEVETAGVGTGGMD